MKQKLSSALRIRLTNEQHSAVNAAASSVGLGICSFARMAVVKAAGLIPAAAPRKPDGHAIALARWTGELGRIGNLANQLAKDRNTGFDVSALDVDEFRDELRKLREVILKFHGPDSVP
jgi:hypothetical protein